MDNEVLDINSPSLVEIINKINKEFDYVIFDGVDFSDFVLDIFERYSPLYNKNLNVTFEDFFESVLKKEISVIVNQKLNDKDFSIVNNFINMKCVESKSKKGIKLIHLLSDLKA